MERDLALERGAGKITQTVAIGIRAGNREAVNEQQAIFKAKHSLDSAAAGCLCGETKARQARAIKLASNLEN